MITVLLERRVRHLLIPQPGDQLVPRGSSHRSGPRWEAAVAVCGKGNLAGIARRSHSPTTARHVFHGSPALVPEPSAPCRPWWHNRSSWVGIRRALQRNVMAARMNDAEAIMWAVESDPFLRTDFTNITLLASAPDPARLRAGLEQAIGVFPPLRQRVARPPLGLAPPQWADDPDFDLRYHLRRLSLPPPGDFRQ